MKITASKVEHTVGKLLPVHSNSNFLLLEGGARQGFIILRSPEAKTEGHRSSISWQLRETTKNAVIRTCIKPETETLGFIIQKKLCGVTLFYLEAGNPGKTGKGITAGLYLRGYAKPLITTAFWTQTKGGEPYHGTLKYGELIWLHLLTEGLNGTILVIEVYFSENGQADLLIATYQAVKCRNGEIDLQIKNTFSWYGPMIHGPDLATFLIKVRSSKNGDNYYRDSNGLDVHAKFLQIEKKLNLCIEKPGNIFPVTG